MFPHIKKLKYFLFFVFKDIKKGDTFTSARGCTSDGVSLPYIYSHAR